MILSLIYLLVSISLNILFLGNPLSLSIYVLIYSFFISLSLRIIVYSWFAFIVFLIYISGIIVIFSYFVVLQPNQRFNLSFFFFFFFSFCLFFIFGSFLGLNDFVCLKWFVSSIYRVNRGSVLLVIGFLLLLVLLAIVKITFINLSSLRPFMRKYV